MCDSPNPLPIIEIDGQIINDLASFFDEVELKLFQSNGYIDLNLDRFNDMLRGGYGTPEGGFVLRWRNSDHSRNALGYAETLKWLERKIEHCHPTNISYVEAEIKAAKAGQGRTIFDILVEIITTHGPGGLEADDSVVLELL